MFKDLPEGQTHYVGDGCNPPHSPLEETNCEKCGAETGKIMIGDEVGQKCGSCGWIDMK